MRTIWKYDLSGSVKQAIEVPLGAKILSLGVQHGTPKIWIEVDPKETKKKILTMHVAGTGHTLSGDEGRFIGTFQLHQGALIFHVYVEE